MSMQEQINILSEMVKDHSTKIIAQSAAISFLSRIMREVMGSNYDEALSVTLSAYERADFDNNEMATKLISELRELLEEEP